MRPIALLPLLLLTTLACDPKESPPPAPATPWASVEAKVKQHDLPGAQAELEALRAQRGDDPDLLVRLAEVRRLQGDANGAILLLRDAAAKAPDSAALALSLASNYLQVGDAVSARETLLRAREAGLEPAQVALLLGTCRARLGEHDEALAEFDRARAAGAEAKIVLYNRALVLGATARHAQALAELDEALKLDPEWVPVRREHARETVLAKPTDRAAVEAALDQLVDLVQVLPEDWRLQESIGDAWMVLGDYEAALQAYTEALRLGKNPSSVEERYRTAVLKQRERAAEAGGGK